MAYDPKDISNTPRGGTIKLIILGVFLPAIIAYFGIRAYAYEATFFYERHRGLIMEYGPVAKALGVTYMGLALYGHVRWFWGLLRFNRLYETGILISLLAIAGGLGWVFWLTFFSWTLN